MTATIILKEDDYLINMLYIASKSKKQKNNRNRTWLGTSVLFFILACMFKMSSNSFFAYYFIGSGLLSLILYPFYLPYKYKKFFKKYVKANYQSKINKECIINFEIDTIETRDITGETKINTSAIEQIIEISTHYFIKLKTGGSLILPKIMFNEHAISQALKPIMEKYEIQLTKELNWKWK